MQNCPWHLPKSQPEIAAVGLPRHVHADQENTQTTDQENTQTTGDATQPRISLLTFSSTEITETVNIT